MEICLAILFTALFPLVAHTSWGLSDCVVDGNFRIKFNGLRLSEVYPGCGYEEACKIAARASRNHILLDSNPAGKNVSFSNPGKLNHDTHSEWTHTLQPGEFMYQFHELLGPRESLRQAKWTEFGGEVDPQIKIKAVAIRNGNGCQIVKQQMPNAKEGDDFILSFYSP